MQDAVLVDVPACFWYDSFVNLKQPVQSALVDVHPRQVGQEVISDKDVEQDEVVDHPLQRVTKRYRRTEFLKLEVEVLAKQGQME